MEDIPLPKILYHYTTQEGLLGILNQKALWATKIHFLNDSSELTSPLKDAKDILSKLEKEKSGKEHDLILMMLDDIDSWESVNICVCSFSQEGDRLSQWRAYGAPGSAYSIGFDPQELSEKAATHLFVLRKCKYFTPVEQKEFIADFITNTITNGMSGDRIGDFIGKFLNLVSTIKNKGFEEEVEWRLVSYQPVMSSDKNFNFRPGKSMIIPYYSLPINLSCITEIIIGPSPHPELVKDAVGGLIHKYNLKLLKNWKINLSAIPYRNW